MKQMQLKKKSNFKKKKDNSTAVLISFYSQ